MLGLALDQVVEEKKMAKALESMALALVDTL